jgi:hypothetical protein
MFVFLFIIKDPFQTTFHNGLKLETTVALGFKLLPLNSVVKSYCVKACDLMGQK